MSTAALPGTYPAPHPGPLGCSTMTLRTVPKLNLTAQTTRRRANIQQGRALEILGHAAEYLVDSRMFFIDEPATKADAEATTILMRLSRQVFSECIDIVPTKVRSRQWMVKQISGRTN